jgi:predicted RNase H-like HicB family nuclease
MDLAGQGGHNRPMQFTVTVLHDETEGVWFVEASDLPGLHAEAATLDALVDAIAEVAPDLAEFNVPEATTDIVLRVQHVVNARRSRAA